MTFFRWLGMAAAGFALLYLFVAGAFALWVKINNDNDHA